MGQNRLESAEFFIQFMLFLKSDTKTDLKLSFCEIDQLIARLDFARRAPKDFTRTDVTQKLN